MKTEQNKSNQSHYFSTEGKHKKSLLILSYIKELVY